MASTSEAMKRNWENPEFREKVKKGSDQYWSKQMRKRLAKLAKGESK